MYKLNWVVARPSVVSMLEDGFVDRQVLCCLWCCEHEILTRKTERNKKSLLAEESFVLGFFSKLKHYQYAYILYSQTNVHSFKK